MKNICPWLRINSHEICGNHCVNAYCFRHAASIRAGHIPPTPCKSCGVGTQCIVNLCQNCGQRKVLDKLFKDRKKIKSTN